MRLIRTIVFLLLYTSPFLRAEEKGVLYYGARSLGAGGTYLTSGEIEEAIFQNPALLPSKKPFSLEKMIFFSPSFLVSGRLPEIIKGLSKADEQVFKELKKIKQSPVQLLASNYSGVIFNNFSLGFLTSASSELNLYNDINRASLETIAVNVYLNYGFLGSFTHEVTKNFVAGITAKGISRRQYKLEKNFADIASIKDLKDSINDYKNSAFALGFDLGMTYLFNPPFPVKLGLTFMDIGDTKFKGDKNKYQIDPLKQTINLGISYQAKFLGGENISSFEVHDLLGNVYKKSFIKKINIGNKFLWKKFIGISFGLNKGQISSGVYLTSRVFDLDFGYYTEEVGSYIGYKNDSRYYLKLMFKL